MDSNQLLNRFIDNEGKVTVWPAKQMNKLIILDYLITKFEKDKDYTEKEVNEILNAWHTFGDWAILRRSLIDGGYMSRENGGYRYRIVKAI